MSKLSPDEVVAYDARRRGVQETVDLMPRGTRATIAYDLRVQPSTVSRVLNGVVVDRGVLEAIAAWLWNNV